MWLEAYISYARSRNINAVRLGVVEQNEPAQAFWEVNGFELEARRPPVRYGKIDNTVLVMRREVRQKS
jgi:ribosomal protein S18 acetylase RimI-like enzyme